MNPQKYQDTEKKIEYLLLGFSSLSQDEKRQLVIRYGKPRRKPFGKHNVKNGPIDITIDYGEVWEDQIIFRQPPDPNKKTLEEIRALEIQDIFSRMIATD